MPCLAGRPASDHPDGKANPFVRILGIFADDFFRFSPRLPWSREDAAMRVYMVGGLLAVMSGAGLFGLELAPQEGRASNAQIVLIHQAPADQGTDGADFGSGTAPRSETCPTAGGSKRKQCREVQRTRLHDPQGDRLPFCRTVETAKADEAAAGRDVGGICERQRRRQRRASTARLHAARHILASWRGPGLLVVVTHGSTIKALTGVNLRKASSSSIPGGQDHRAASGHRKDRDADI